VLGSTGRNFAAGMSGGIAYVLDEDGSFNKRCNMSMVEFEEMVEDELALPIGLDGKVDIRGDMTRHDCERLKALIERHHAWTGSPRAKAILDDWAAWRGKFIKVMPTEYRKALEAMTASRLAAE